MLFGKRSHTVGKSVVTLGAVGASGSAMALDTTAVEAAIAAAQANVDSVALAILAVAATLFAISKIRQIIKA